MRIIIFLFIVIPFLSNAQYDANHSPNTYQSIENPYYWKNKMPHPAYWQQDVHYEIKASIDDSTDIIDANFYKLTYWNNSPHTLNHLYFHLYQNAFQPNSHMHDLYLNNQQKISFGDYEVQKKGTEITEIKVNGQKVDTTLDNTILKVDLNSPLLPNDSIVITMKFKTYFDAGTLRRRMKTFDSYNEKHYDGVHWYPSIAVYDHKFSWTSEQHLDKEFYADFGTFDVDLTFPHHFILDATGTLQNPEEIFIDSLREKIDIKNFKKPSSTPSIIIPKEKGKTKTWRYHAENVHNFAFTADPSYRIGEIEWNGIKVVTLVQEPHAGKWQKSGTFCKEVIKTYSEDFGMYAWPKIIIADANDGMEYPMLTLDGGQYPNHQGLIAHEVGHMWFYGMLGSNETYRAMMDEGFTQFLTIWSMDRLTGKSKERSSNSSYVTKRLDPYRTGYERLYYPYLKTVQRGFDKPLNTHSSDFNGAIRHGGNYGLVYYKTGVMLYNLQYVLGDDLFQKAMQFYFNQWKMAHPYPEDFRNSIIEYTQVDLNWFFDQWMETTKTIDYGIKKIKKIDETHTEVTFNRKGTMQMPVDFIAILNNGDTLNYHIPNTWFKKEFEGKILPKWYGWGNIHKTYTINLETTIPIKNIVIDPTHAMADINLLNNSWKGVHPIRFDHKVKNLPNWEKPQTAIRPDIWFNNYDGAQIGAHINGNYFGDIYTYSLTVWGNTSIGQYDVNELYNNDYSPVSFEASSSQQIKSLNHKLFFKQYALHNAGLSKAGLSVVQHFQKRDAWNPNKTTVQFGMNFMNRFSHKQLDYLFLPLWSENQYNNTLDLSIKRTYKKDRLTGKLTTSIRTPGLFSDFNYSYLTLENKSKIQAKKLAISTRLYGRLGFGSNLASESALYLAGASPEELYNNKFTRAGGIIPLNWTSLGNETNHFQATGGLNLRGYNGFALTPLFSGKSGISFTTEIDFQNLIAIKRQKLTKPFSFRTYAFIDIASISTDNKVIYEPLSDAGIGTVLKIRFPRLDIKPLEIRFDLPFFLSHPVGDNKHFQTRYLLGINSTF